MKKIKIASFFVAVATLLSSVSVAFAATVSGTENMVVTAEKVDWTDSAYNEYSSLISSGLKDTAKYESYLLTFTLKGFQLETILDDSGMEPLLGGTAITALKIKMNTSSSTGQPKKQYLINSAYTAQDTMLDQWSDTTKVTTVGKGTSACYPTDTKTVTANDEFVLFKALVTTQKNLDLSINFEGSSAAIADISEGGVVGGSSVEAFLSANTITLPLAEGYAFSAGTENKYSNGIVWAGASMTNYNTTLNEYYAEFTADDVTEPRKTLIRSLPESEKGTITFDAVMWFAGEAKTGVTFKINEYKLAE